MGTDHGIRLQLGNDLGRLRIKNAVQSKPGEAVQRFIILCPVKQADQLGLDGQRLAVCREDQRSHRRVKKLSEFDDAAMNLGVELFDAARKCMGGLSVTGAETFR